MLLVFFLSVCLPLILSVQGSFFLCHLFPWLSIFLIAFQGGQPGKHATPAGLEVRTNHGLNNTEFVSQQKTIVYSDCDLWVVNKLKPVNKSESSLS